MTTDHDPNLVDLLTEVLTCSNTFSSIDTTTLATVNAIVADVLVGLAQRGYGIAPVPAIARWCVDQLGYPFDMHTDVPPPPILRRAIVAEWVARDGDGDPETARYIEQTAAEEGRWA